ncbi:MAG: D-glycerate dehydrogenase [Patescibacteria group bacterium]
MTKNIGKKVFITRKIPDLAEKMLRENDFDVDVWPRDRAMSRKEIIKRLKKEKYDAVLCLLTDKMDAKIFDASPATKIFANYATGYDNIDVEEAKRRNIAVTNTPGVSSIAVAEHAFAMMLALTTRLVEGDTFIRKGKYLGWAPMNFVGTDFTGKTIGLIGVGNIGSQVARMAYGGFGAKIIYTDIRQNREVEEKYGAQKCESLESLLAQADMVSLHVPLIDSTYHLINETRLKMMKPTAFLINTSRGPVVDEATLVKALQNKTIRGAALDVFEFEPRLAFGLAKLSNVILTPHIASARESVRREMARLSAQSIIDFFAGKTPENKVN